MGEEDPKSRGDARPGAICRAGRLECMPTNPKPPRTGTGALTIARDVQPVEFSIHLVNAVNGRRGGKGSVTGDPDAMRAAFRAGRVHLTLDDGAKLDVAVVAHAEGSPTAYFQLDKD